MKACMKSLSPEIQNFLSHWGLWVSATSSFSVKSSSYRKLSSKEMWPFLSFIFISLQRLVLSTLSVLHFHSLVKPLLQELQRHETSGVQKETDGRGQKTRQYFPRQVCFCPFFVVSQYFTWNSEYKNIVDWYHIPALEHSETKWKQKSFEKFSRSVEVGEKPKTAI